MTQAIYQLHGQRRKPLAVQLILTTVLILSRLKFDEHVSDIFCVRSEDRDVHSDCKVVNDTFASLYHCCTAQKTPLFSWHVINFLGR